MISAIPRIFRGYRAPRGAEESWQKATAGPRLWKTAKPRGLFLYLYGLEFFYEERPYRVEDGDYHNADVCEYREPHVCEAERAERKEQRAAAKAADRAAHADERAAEDAARAAHKAERAAYDKKQARKRAILKALREQGK